MSQQISPGQADEHGFAFPTWEAALRDAANGIEAAHERRRRTFEAANKAGLSFATIGAAVGLSAAGVHKIVRGKNPQRARTQEELLKGSASGEDR